MKCKEFKVGELFQCGLVKLKVEKAECIGCDGCLKCFIYKNHIDCKLVDSILGECEAEKREDKTDVIFVKVEG